MSKKLDHAVSLYMEGIRDGHYVEAINQYTGNQYIQHSTGVKDGKEGFIAFFSDFVARNPVRDIEIIRKLEDGHYVFLQAYQNINHGASQWITTDFFDTDQEDRIIEHWDVISAYEDAASIDGPTKMTDLDQTDANKALVRTFFKGVLLPGGDPQTLERYVSKDHYIQHNITIEDGLETFQALLQNPHSPLQYKELVLLIGQGNFVATLSKVTSTEKSVAQDYAQVDLFRIENHLIVEHWDNREPVPEVSVNRGKF